MTPRLPPCTIVLVMLALAFYTAFNVRLGDLSSRVLAPMMMVYSLKKKLGVIPDFEKDVERTGNTALAYHAG